MSKSSAKNLPYISALSNLIFYIIKKVKIKIIKIATK